MGNYFFQSIMAFLEALICVMIFSIVTKNNFFRDKKAQAFLLILGYVVMLFFTKKIAPIGIHTILMVIICSVLFSIVTRVSIKKSLKSFAFFTIFIMTIETCVMMVTAFYFKINSKEILEISKLSNLLYTISKSIEIFIIFSVISYKKKIIVDLKKENNNSIMNYWIFGIFLLSILILNFTMMKEYNLELRYFIVAVYIIYIFFIIVGYFQYKNFIDYIKIKYSLEQNKKELENLESMIDVIRKQKHGFANIINTVYAISVMNKPDSNEKIRSYLKSVINDSTTPNYFYNSGNDYLDGLLAIKKKDANNEKISFEVDFENQYEGIRIENNDMVKIVSNVIDNAIQAHKKYEMHRDNKIISIYHWIEDNISNFSISNNGPIIDQSIKKKIFEKGFTDKEKESKDHGYGLYIVKELVQKYSGEILVTSDENSTEFLIKLPT